MVSSIETTTTKLGVAGLAPFVVTTLALVFSRGDLHVLSVELLATYGALILAFMGAVHFGLALRVPGARATLQLTVSVIPALLAWGALMLPRPITFAILALGFAAVYFFDLWSANYGELPTWYPRLRVALTTVVVVCLLTGAVLTGFSFNPEILD